MEDLKQPLVSIIVITYNSSKYVLETLESAKAQTYHNIELIVSDDCSPDNTVQICKDWIENNKGRFVRTELVTTDKNTGVPANCNRGILVSKGEWVKLIAGDDILLDDCVNLNIQFVNKNETIDIAFSNSELFCNENGDMTTMYSQPLDEQKKWFNCDAKKQYSRLLQDNFIWTSPSSFIKKKLLLKYNMFDERFPLFEDYPFWLKITRNNVSLYYFDQPTVRYRQSDSITRVRNVWFNEKYFDSYRLHFSIEVGSVLKRKNAKVYLLRNIYIFKIYVLVKVFKNKKNILAKIFDRLFNYIFPNSNL